MKEYAIHVLKKKNNNKNLRKPLHVQYSIKCENIVLRKNKKKNHTHYVKTLFMLVKYVLKIVRYKSVIYKTNIQKGNERIVKKKKIPYRVTVSCEKYKYIFYAIYSLMAKKQKTKSTKIKRI